MLPRRISAARCHGPPSASKEQHCHSRLRSTIRPAAEEYHLQSRSSTIVGYQGESSTAEERQLYPPPRIATPCCHPLLRSTIRPTKEQQLRSPRRSSHDIPHSGQSPCLHLRSTVHPAEGQQRCPPPRSSRDVRC